jgi:hypothetical protein
MGKPAVTSLSRTLRNSKADQVRWEAAKALGAMGDVRAIPSLVQALEDSDDGVAWLAAEGLKQFNKAAWPALFHALIERGADSAQLRHGAHHVLREQREDGFNALLETLRKALEAVTVPVRTPIAAHNILKKMGVSRQQGPK